MTPETAWAPNSLSPPSPGATVYEPWLRPSFEFSPEFAERVWRTSVIENPNLYRVNTPRDFFFSNRLHFGLSRFIEDNPISP